MTRKFIVAKCRSDRLSVSFEIQSIRVYSSIYLSKKSWTQEFRNFCLKYKTFWYCARVWHKWYAIVFEIFANYIVTSIFSGCNMYVHHVWYIWYIVILFLFVSSFLRNKQMLASIEHLNISLCSRHISHPKYY